MSEYQAQFSPRASSSRRSRVPTSMLAACTPSRIHGRSPSAELGFGPTHQHRCAAGTAVRARVGQEVALALEAQAERRRDHRLPHDREVVQRVVEAEREADDQQRGADLDGIRRGRQVAGRIGAVDGGRGQRRTLDLDHCHVDLARRVAALPPHALTVAIQRNREAGGAGHVGRVGVEFDLDPVRKVFAAFILHDMPARHQEKPPVALEEEPARVGQQLVLGEGGDGRCREQNCFDHRRNLAILGKTALTARAPSSTCPRRRRLPASTTCAR